MYNGDPYLNDELKEQEDPMAAITNMLDSIDKKKELSIVNRKMLQTYGQLKVIGQKRAQEQVVASESLDLNPSNYKKIRSGEKYTDQSEFF